MEVISINIKKQLNKMETSIFEIEFNDGRIFRIFCANSTQYKKATSIFNDLKSEIKEVKNISNGINTFTEFNQMVGKGYFKSN